MHFSMKCFLILFRILCIVDTGTKGKRDTTPELSSVTVTVSTWYSSVTYFETGLRSWYSNSQKPAKQNIPDYLIIRVWFKFWEGSVWTTTTVFMDRKIERWHSKSNTNESLCQWGLSLTETKNNVLGKYNVRFQSNEVRERTRVNKVWETYSWHLLFNNVNTDQPVMPASD